MKGDFHFERPRVSEAYSNQSGGSDGGAVLGVVVTGILAVSAFAGCLNLFRSKAPPVPAPEQPQTAPALPPRQIPNKFGFSGDQLRRDVTCDIRLRDVALPPLPQPRW